MVEKHKAEVIVYEKDVSESSARLKTSFPRYACFVATPQEAGRPIVAWLPHRVKNVKIVDGGDLRPTITDDFILIPNPGKVEPGRSYRVVFTAEKQGG